MRVRRVHHWWTVPLVVVAALAGAGWWFIDSLYYGNASSLHRAVMQEDFGRVKRLVSRGADVNRRMYADLYPWTWGATPLHLAARRDNGAIVDELIRAGADRDTTDQLGFTPLHGAIESRADATAQALIRAGAKVNAPVGEGRAAYAIENCGQPVRTSLQRGSITTVRAMLDAGADPRTDIGEDAMGWADAPDLLPKLQLLLERGFSVEGAGFQSRRPLHVAAANNDIAAIEFLLGHGARIEAKGGEYKLTPLLMAAYYGANDAVKVLLERGANPKAGTNDFGSPIYAAAFSGKTGTVRLLLSMKLGIDLQAGRSDRATPLHFAYWNGDMEMARLLIEAGADENARTTDGRLPSAYRK